MTDTTETTPTPAAEPTTVEPEKATAWKDTPPEEPKGKTFYCSFCGKSQHAVRKLIASAQSFICDECVSLCVAIVASDDPAYLDILIKDYVDDIQPESPDALAGKRLGRLEDLKMRVEAALEKERAAAGLPKTVDTPLVTELRETLMADVRAALGECEQRMATVMHEEIERLKAKCPE